MIIFPLMTSCQLTPESFRCETKQFVSRDYITVFACYYNYAMRNAAQQYYISKSLQSYCIEFRLLVLTSSNRSPSIYSSKSFKRNSYRTEGSIQQSQKTPFSQWHILIQSFSAQRRITDICTGKRSRLHHFASQL